MERDILPVTAQITAIARERPGDPAVAHPGAVSYADLVGQAELRARFMRGRGVTQGKHVVVWLASPADAVQVSLAALYAGAAFVPLEERTPLARATAIINSCDPALIIVDGDRLLALAPEQMARVITIDVLDCASREPMAPSVLPEVVGSDAAYVIFTSGSTGEPKGVVVSHDNLAHLVRARTALYGAEPNICPTHPCSFDPFQGAVWWSLARGGTLVLLRTPELSDLELIGSLIRSHKVKQLSVVPSVYEALLKHTESGADTTSLKTVIVGGEAFPSSLAALHYARLGGCTLWNEYGPTEATVVSTAYQVPPVPPTPVPIGRALLGVTCYVVNEAGALCATDEPGELFIGGSGVAVGYLNQSDLTAAKFVTPSFAENRRVYRTGDRVRWNERQELEFLGRLDGQLKLRGNRIEPEEIELALLSQAGIVGAGVAVRTLRGDQPVLVAFCVTADSDLPAALERALRALLPPYMVPAVYFKVESLPRTPAGKLDRAELTRIALPEIQRSAEILPPVSPAEIDLAHAWSQVLAIPLEQIGRDSEFFALGGHSLLFARVERSMRSEFERTAPLATFWSHTTLASLAAELTAAPDEGPRDSMRRIQRYPLAPIQETFYYLAELDPSSSAYTVGATVRILGAIDRVRLRAAIRRTFEVNDLLRVRLVRRSVVPELSVQALDRSDAWFSFSELEAESEQAAGALAEAFITQLIPIDALSLVRFQVTSVSDQDHLISLAAHHLVVDGMSVHLLFLELWKYYADEQALPTSTRSYGEFALATRRRLSEASTARLKETWRERLADVSLPAQVPYSRKATAESLPAGAPSQLVASIPPELATRVQSFARSRNVSPFMVALAATGLVLARYQGEPDVTVATPVSLRGLGDFHRTIGCMVNSAVLRLAVDSWDTVFDDWVLASRRAVTGAAVAAELPIAAVYEALGRSATAAPLFRFFFNYLDRTEEVATLDGARLVPVLEGKPTAKFEITLYVHDWGNRWDLEFVFAPELYDSDTIASLSSHIVHVLKQLPDIGEQALARIALAPEAASVASAHASVREAAEESVDTIHAGFIAAAEQYPERIAVDDGVQVWSYRELAQRASSAANAIRAHAPGPSVRVAIAANRNAWFVACVIACLESGVLYTVVDAAQPPSLQRAVLDSFAPSLTLDPDGVFDESWPFATLRGHQFLAPTGSATLRNLKAGAADLVYVLFTSGTTGRPKGIVGSHAPVVRFLRWQAETYRFSIADRFALLAGLGHDPVFRDLFAPLSAGAVLHIPSAETRSESANLAQWLRANSITVGHMTPPLAELLAGTGVSLPDLRIVFCGGDRLRPEQVKAFFACAPKVRLFNCYGLTETPQIVSLQELQRDEAFASVPVGNGIPGFELSLRNVAGRPCAVNEVGEIVVQSEHLARGVWDEGRLKPLSTSTDSHTLRTGDIGRLDTQGRIHFLQRRDRQVKLRGFRLSFEDVESVLAQAPRVQAARVLVHTLHGESVLWAFVTAAGERPKERAVRAYVAERAIAAAVPQRIYVIPSFPLTRNGKLDEKALLAFAEHYDEEAPPSSIRLASGAAPETQTEDLISKVWCKCLNRVFVAMEDDFFRIGGTSLLAVQMISKLSAELGIPISVQTLLQNPTPRRLATALLQQNSSLEESLVMALNTSGTLPIVWMFHAVGGHVLFVRRFAELVGARQPVYTIQARGLDGIQTPLSSLSEMVELYTSLVVQHQPVGPYYLSGPSFGGRLALEIARALTARGERIALVGMFDSYAPGYPVRPPLHQRAWKAVVRAVSAKVQYDNPDYQPFNGSRPDEPMVEMVTAVITANSQAARGHTPAFYDGEVRLFRATRLPVDRNGADFSDETCGWQKYVRRVRVEGVDTTHQAIMDSPGVEELVQKFQLALAECRSQVGHFDEHDDG